MTSLSEPELRSLFRASGKSETLEYKERPAEPEEFATDLVAFANTRGGRILVGVADDGRIVGFDGRRFDEWVASVSRDKVDPPLIPSVQRYDLAEGRVWVVAVDAGADACARYHKNRRTYFVRIGSVVREASREELSRLFQRRGHLHAEEFPVRGTSADDLDGPALRDYVRTFHKKDLKTLEASDRGRLLYNLGYLDSPDGPATLAGLALFGENPHERLPEAALRSKTRARGSRLKTRTEIPHDALREALVNAVVHRDYTLRGRPVRVMIFEHETTVRPDGTRGPEGGCVLVRSPGTPPNKLTVDRMKEGAGSFPCNPLIFSAMANLAYVENLGRGVQRIMEATRRVGRPAEVLVDVDETVVRFPRPA